MGMLKRKIFGDGIGEVHTMTMYLALKYASLAFIIG